MSIFGRRGSSGEGWTWSSPPRPPSRPRRFPLPPIIGGGVVGLIVALAVIATCVSDDEPAGGSAPSPTPSVAGRTGTPEPTPTLEATATPSPTPAATTSLTSDGSTFRLALWTGREWRSEHADDLPYRKGEAVPFLLRIENAQSGAVYSLTLRHECRGLDRLTVYSRDVGDAPALGQGGPGLAIPDSTIPIPGDPSESPAGQPGDLSLWGGVFLATGGPRPAAGCQGQRELDVSLRALGGAVFLLWGATLADGAAGAGAPFPMTVEVADVGELSLPLDPSAVRPQP